MPESPNEKPPVPPPSKDQVRDRILRGEYVTVAKFGARSNVWKHFELVKDPNTGKYHPWIWAKSCKSLYKYGSDKSTRSASSHLLTCGKYQKVQALKIEAEANATGEQYGLNKYLKKKIPQMVYGEAYDLLAELCARSGIPARFVEWDGLEKLLDAFIGYGAKYGKSAKACDFLCSPNTITK